MNDRLAFINRQLLLLAQLNAINRWNNCKRLKSLADTWLAYWGKSVKMRSRADNFKWPPRTPSIWSSDGGGLSLHTKQLIMGHNKLWQTFQNVISLDSNRFSAVLAPFRGGKLSGVKGGGGGWLDVICLELCGDILSSLGARVQSEKQGSSFSSHLSYLNCACG